MSWPPTTEEEDQNDAPVPGRRVRVMEDVFILLCVLSLWPVLLGWDHILYRVLMYTTLAGLVFILVRRVRRFSQARRDSDNTLG
ncbi:MAG TPA: hypothetical protein DIC52_13600 [Candidatus Latescibacteria bacterium]|nr:hypothetical protein [Candidatus Latescibacterota bacterium]